MSDVDLGTMSFKKGSYDRLWIVLGALAFKEGKATLKELSDLVNMPRSTTEDILNKVLDNQVPELIIVREQATFTIESWGLFLSKKKLLDYYNKTINNG